MNTVKGFLILELLLFAAPAMAFEPLQGVFAASDTCPALQSIKKGSNPGDVRLQVGARYAVYGRNEPGGRYFQVEVPKALPERRWVDAACGELVSSDPGSESSAPPAGRYLLAASWQPSFCETRPVKAECKAQNPERFDATHLALHGLWPQPESKAFCGVTDGDRQADKTGRWEQLPQPAISDATRQRLAVAMPGMASQLDRHEYTKHGTCFPGSADQYFRTALSLLDQLNASRLQPVLAANLGQPVSAGELRRAFEQSFGPGAGKALEIHCVGDIDSRRTLISEVRVSLQGSLTDTSRLRDALDTQSEGSDDCVRGIVDAVGLN